MATANGICSKALASWSIVLMARIVDRAGATIRPLDVRAIEYSLCEVDPYWPAQLTALRSHRAVPLAVRDVLFDSLQDGRAWTVDDLGFNFRHEINFGADEPSSQAGCCYELVYRLTMKIGQTTTVRFLLGCSMLDARYPASRI